MTYECIYCHKLFDHKPVGKKKYLKAGKVINKLPIGDSASEGEYVMVMNGIYCSKQCAVSDSL